MLEKGDRVPHFSVTTVDGRRVEYRDLWQRKNLLLVCLPRTSDSADEAYAAALASQVPAAEHETACVITRDSVAGVDPPGVLVADRWGEIAFGAHARTGELPAASELTQWLQYVQYQCPECQGEAR